MSNNTFKRVVFFDFTGTLFDPFIQIRSILNSVAKEKGYKHYDETELTCVNKVPPSALLNKFSIPDTDKKVVVTEVLIRLEDEIQHIPPIPGIKNMLFTLSAQNSYLGILSSNSKSNITKWLLTNNLDIFHDVVCISFQETKTPYLEAIKTQFTSINDFFFISDEAKDLVQAQEAGFSSVGVTWGFDGLASLKQVNPGTIISAPEHFFSIYTK